MHSDHGIANEFWRLSWVSGPAPGGGAYSISSIARDQVIIVTDEQAKSLEHILRHRKKAR